MPDVTFEIRKTFEEISLAIARSGTPIKIFQIVNHISPRSWQFDISDGITLKISTVPPLTVQDAKQIIICANEQLFNCTRMRFVAENEEQLVEYTFLAAGRSCSVTVSGENHSGKGKLILENFGGRHLHKDLANDEGIRNFVKDFTWVGSSMLRASEATCGISFKRFGAVMNIETGGRYASSEPSFQKEVQIVGEKVVLKIFARHKRRSDRIRMYHTYFGVMPVLEEVANGLGRLIDDHTIYLDLELKESALTIWPDETVSPWNILVSTTEKLINTAKDILKDTEFKNFLEKCKEQEVVAQANVLIERQVSLRDRGKVYVDNRFLGYEPRSENEVMLLSAKLEILGKMPLSKFALYEYTPKQGIDALGDLQIGPGDAVMEVVPIELENNFESFFDHGHPAGQVKAIVCWKLRNSSTTRDRNLERRRPGLYSCSLEGHQVYVIVISELSGLTIK